MNNINCRYEIIEKLGEGSSGNVYLVHDIMYGKIKRALKIIRVAGKPSEILPSLRNEFSILRQFDHPNIVKVYDFGNVVVTDTDEYKDDFFFTLDYIQGQDLYKATEHASDEFISSLMYQIAHALDYIHRHGLIHFDIKPENIFVTEMQFGDATVFIPKIIDFGFAAPLLDSPTRSLKGSLHFIAPELISGEKYDHRADLYSLGVTLFQILSRNLPFDSKDAVDLLKMHHNEKTTDIAKLRPGTRPELIELVSELMEKDIRKRMFSARNVSEKLIPLVRQTTVFKDYTVENPPIDFVGKKKELQRLNVFLNSGLSSKKTSAFSEGKRVICVVGEQGVGKTPLIEEWRRQAQSDGILIIKTICFLNTSPPLEPFRWLLHELKFALLPQGVRGSELLEKYDHLFSSLSYTTDEENESNASLVFTDEESQSEYLRSFIGLLIDAVTVIPFALSIDDIHLADEMSIQLLRMLTRSGDSKIPLILLSCESIATIQKDLRLELNSVEVIVLSGIDEEDVMELIKSQIGISDMPKELARNVLDKVGDSLYVIKEFLAQFRNLPSEDVLPKLQKALTLPAVESEFPHNVNDVYEKRFQRLGPEEQHILKVVSCFRVPVKSEIIVKICSVPSNRLSHYLTLLTMNGIFTLFENGSKVQFAFIRFREFVYQNLRSEKQRLQNEIAETLEMYFTDAHESEDEKIGFHFKEAGKNKKAYAYYMSAAQSAVLAHSLRDSITLLEEGKNLASDETELVNAIEKLAHQSDLVEDYEKAETLYETLLTRPNTSIANSYRYLKALGSVQTRRGLLDKAIDTFTKASHVAQAPREFMEIEDELADIDISRGRLSEARSRCMECLKNLHEPENGTQKSSLLTKLGIISFYETKYDEATEYFLLAYNILERIGDKTKIISPLLNLGNAYSVRHNYEKALQSWNQALRYAEEIGNFHQQGQIYNNLGIAEYAQGHFENALLHYLKGINIFSHLDHSPGLALCLNNAGEVYMVQSEYEKAFDVWEKCLDLHTNSGDAHGIAETHNHLSKLFLIFNDKVNAREQLQKSRQIIESANLEAKWPIYYLNCGALAFAEKKFGDAEQFILQAKERFKSIGEEINYCESLFIEGRIRRYLGLLREAADNFEEIVQKGTDLNLPLLKAEALLELGISSRAHTLELRKKTLTYLKEAYDLIEHEPVNEITWKICYEIAAEYEQRGIGFKSKAYFLKAMHALLYVGSLFTSQSLQKKFWDSEHRGTIVKKIESLLVDTQG